jgi:diguanylate cyclase (GGDEF)-like protein
LAIDPASKSQMLTIEPSTIGLWVQWVASLVLLALTFLVTRSARLPWLAYWTLAWLSLSLSFGSLLVGFADMARATPFVTLYFLGEYAFGFGLFWGCRRFASGIRPGGRELLFTLPALAIGLGLPHLDGDFNILFGLHAGVMALLFGASAFSLLRIPKGERGPGFYVMSVALAVLCLDFAHYLPVFLYTSTLPVAEGFPYLRYTPFVDLIMETLLGFGMVMVTMEHIRRDLERANAKLEMVAQLDPLTEALNRHAFSAMGLADTDLASRPEGGGCVAVVDMDNLKAINDTYGHAAGDLAIRSVAREIRSVIRADDLLFRWGGDEFLVLLWNMRTEDAEERFARLEGNLAGAELPPPLHGAKVSVSVGVAAYPASGPLDIAIEEADRSMYERKRSHRSDGRGAP